jgi:glycosyltransferase involved in cell wall biosynthesis
LNEIKETKQIVVLIIVGYYYPGFKAGGPINSIVNLVAKLGGEFKFKIVTQDHDLGENVSYKNILIDSWQKVDNADVFYMSPKNNITKIKRILCATKHDVLYLNSFFSLQYAINILLLRKLKLIPYKPLIIAPRGEFSPGAIRIKYYKKYIYVICSRAIHLFNQVIWQASSGFEKNDIERVLGDSAYIYIANNLPPVISQIKHRKEKCDNRTDILRVIFLSRISRKKNLHYALNRLSYLKGKVQFNIYGPIENKEYWSKCKKIISGLRSNIKVKYCGSLKHNQVNGVMNEHNLFFLPTLGENFGHVIMEAFMGGCPVLISDQTPWRGLEELGVGWDISLNKPEKYQKILQKLINSSADEREKWSKKATKYGLDILNDKDIIDHNRQLFNVNNNN